MIDKCRYCESPVFNILTDFILMKQAREATWDIYSILWNETDCSKTEKNITSVLDRYFKGETKSLQDECLNQIMMIWKSAEKVKFKTKTITVNLSENKKEYMMLLSHIEKSESQKEFKQRLVTALCNDIPNFRVPVYDPSINKNKYVEFVPNAEPASMIDYYDIEAHANRIGAEIGTIDQYILFMASMILLIIQKGNSEDDVWQWICDDSSGLKNLDKTNCFKENCTGSLDVYGKFDLISKPKIVTSNYKGEKVYHTVITEKSPGYYTNISLTEISDRYSYDSSFSSFVPWYIFPETK